jgi:enoyl-CoA hydratase
MKEVWMKYDTILYEPEGSTALITFNRPEKRNALNEKLSREIESALLSAEADPAVKAIILTGGMKFFISGADIEFLSGKGEELTPHRMYETHFKTQSLYRTLSSLPKPTIAAIAGYALGGGLELALCCDFRIAAKNTRLGVPEIKLGILPGAGGTQRLSRLIGLTKAKEMVLTGEPILAEDAFQLGLLNKVVALEELMNEARAFAGKFSNLPSFAVEIAKSVLDTGANLSLKDSLELERLGFSMLYSTEDQKEGLRAFLEKRVPRFQGK